MTRDSKTNLALQSSLSVEPSIYFLTSVTDDGHRGGEGIDFDANLAISTLDFGTFHVSKGYLQRL